MKCYTLFFVHDETMKIKPFIFLPPFGKHWVNNEQLFQVIIRKKQAKKKILILNKYTSHQLRNPHAIHVHTHTLEVIFYNIHLFVLPCTFKHKDN